MESHINRTAEQQQLLQGIGAFILARSVPLLDLDDRLNGGSGVLLSFYDRHFVATAAHVIEASHRYAILMREFNKKYADVVSKHIDEINDVGILELDSSSIGQLLQLQHQFLSDEQLFVGRYPTMRMPIRVTGFPSYKEMRPTTRQRISRSTTIHTIGFSSLSYDTFALPRSRWPKLSAESRACRRSDDIFCSWDPHEEGTEFSLLSLSDAPKKKRFGPVTLPGMSGGGIWLPSEDNSNGRISTPIAYLVGIQTSYSEGGRRKWLRGTRTKVLVRLFEKYFPDLIHNVAV